MRFRRALPLAALCLTAAACGGGGGGGGGSGGDSSVWHLRSVNVIRDSSNVQFFVDDTVVANADYGSVTDYKPAHTGTRPLRLVVANPPDLSGTDQGTTVISPDENFDFQGATDYTLVAAGTVAAPHKFLITGTSSAAVEDNKVNYQFINAAVDAGPLDVYIKAPEGGIAALQQVAVLDAGESSPATDLSVAAASGASADATRSVNISIEIRDPVTHVALYQSSALNIAEQSRLLLVVADNVGPPGVAPVKVLLVGGAGAGVAGVALDTGDGAELRFANLSPDAGSLDLIVGTSATDVFASDIALGQASPYGALAVGNFNSIGTPHGNAGSFLFVNNFSTARDVSYTLYAQGTLASMRGLLFVDDRRGIAGQSRFRFMHASPAEASHTLDIYVRRTGEGLDLNATTPPAPSVAALAYRSLSSGLALKPGTYDVFLAHAGAKTTIAGSPFPLVLPAAGVQTVAFDDAPGGGFQLVPVDDARP